MNTVTESLDSTTRQMTEMFQQKKQDWNSTKSIQKR